MPEPLILEAAALSLLLLLHFIPTHPPVRRWLVAVLGARAHQGLFAIAAAMTLIWAVLSWRDADYVELWSTPYGWRYVAMAINALAYVLLGCALLTPNPTAAGMDGRVALEPKGIFAVTRHPMMWGIGLWALTHVVSNGHLASTMLFGSLAFLALIGPLHMEVRKRAERGAEWDGFVAGSSYVPFAAILAGRARFDPAAIGGWRVAAGLGLFGLALWLHDTVSGFDLTTDLY